MAGQIWLIADRAAGTSGRQGSAGAQEAYLLDVPDGSDVMATATEFAGMQNFPTGTAITLIDMTGKTVQINKFQLASQWVAA